MANYKCPRCGEKYDDSMPECPVCGFETGAYTVETFFGHEPEQRRTSSGHRKKKSRARRAVPVICALVLAIVVVLGIVFFVYIKPLDSYNYGVTLMLRGDYAKAENVFESLGDFKDSESLAMECAGKREEEEAERARNAALENDYAEAEKLLNQGELEQAMEAFSALGDFSDAPSRVEECDLKIRERAYGNALDLLENDQLNDALMAFAESRGYGDAERYCTEITEILEKSDELAELKTGDVFVFGSIEQDGDETNGAEPIEWYVLENDGENILLLSRYIIATSYFNSEETECDWESSSLRAYLNSDFFDDTFSASEQRLIAAVNVEAELNPRFALVGQGGDTIDKVWLLSAAKVNALQSSNSDLLMTEAVPAAKTVIHTDAVHTAMGVARPASTQETSRNWWLRTMGSSRYKACTSDNRGNANVGGMDVQSDGYGIRPVISLKLY